MTQSNDFVCLSPNNPSVINNCKLVPGKNGLKGSKFLNTICKKLFSEKTNTANARLNDLNGKLSFIHKHRLILKF